MPACIGAKNLEALRYAVRCSVSNFHQGVSPVASRARPATTMRRLFATLRHHLVWVVAFIVVFAGAGVAYSQSSDLTYTSESTLLLSPVPGTPLSPEAATSSANQLTIAMSTEAELVSTPPVNLLAGERAGTTLPASGDVLRVDVPSATQTLRIRYTSGSAADAANRAQAYAEAYLAYRSQLGEAQQQARLDQLEEQASAARAGLQEVSDSEGIFARRQAEIFSARLAQLSALISAEEIVSTEPGTVVLDAEEPSQPDGLRPWLVLVLAIVLGAVVGVLFAMWREWQKNAIRTAFDTQVDTIPILTTVNTSGTAEIRGSDDVLREARNVISARTTPPTTLALVPVEPVKDIRPVSLALSAQIAAAGYTVAAVDARTVGTASDEEAGLTEVLSGQMALQDVLSRIDGVDVLNAGTLSSQGRDLRAGAPVRHLLAELQKAHDYVVVLSDEADSGGSEMALTCANEVVFIVQDGVSRRESLLASSAHLDALSLDSLGALALRVGRSPTTSSSAWRKPG